MTKRCSECGVRFRQPVRAAALGRFVSLCPDCKKSFDLALGLPLDLSLRCLDREVRALTQEVNWWR